MFLFIFYVTHEYIKQYADVAELADAPDLGSGVYDVQVQVLSSAVNFFPEVLINIALSGFFLSEKTGMKKEAAH